MDATPSTSLWRRWLAAALLLAAPLPGWSQQADADPPTRVAYVSALEGPARIAQDERAGWAPATLNWPVTTGTRVALDAGSRAELHGGWIALRLHGPADLSITALDDDTTQVALTQGTLSLRVRELQPGERVEIDTPQLAVVASQPGEYRVDVDPRADTTRVTVHAGSATVYGEGGQSTTMAGRQQTVFAGRALGVVQAGPALGRDALDQWAAARDALEDQSRSARYLSRDMPGYQQLDQYGEWGQDATYGPVWYPSVTVADWAPYRHGRWTWVAPWGWTWVDDAPWGFAPSHYGRWAQIGPRWAWVPGPVARRPVYAPALVGFVGGAGSGGSWGVSLGGGLPGAAWFPLAPGEHWQPHYHASPRYRRRVNDWGGPTERVRPPADNFHFQRRPHAITVAPHEQFGGGERGRRPRFGDGSRLPPGVLDGSRVIAPPPRAYVPGLPTQAPLSTRRPDARMTDPDRFGAERGVAPPRLRQDAPPPRIIEGVRPEDRPPARSTPMARPGWDRDRERDRMVRDQPPRPPQVLPMAPAPPRPMPQAAPRQMERPAPPDRLGGERHRAMPGVTRGNDAPLMQQDRQREERRGPARQQRGPDGAQ